MLHPSQHAAPEFAANDQAPMEHTTEPAQTSRTAGSPAHRATVGLRFASPARAHRGYRPAAAASLRASEQEGRLGLPLWKVGVSILP